MGVVIGLSTLSIKFGLQFYEADYSGLIAAVTVR